MSKFWDKIKEIRASNNLTLQEIVDSLGYTSSSIINKIEKGINDIAFSHIVSIELIQEISFFFALKVYYTS